MISVSIDKKVNQILRYEGKYQSAFGKNNFILLLSKFSNVQ
jgi:hypothetical protein